MTMLCISGKRGSGKSMLARFLCRIDPHMMQWSLAGYLKHLCYTQFGLDHAQLNGNLKETPTEYVRTDGSPLTPRDIMIRMGIFYRSIDPLFWCKKFYIWPSANYVIDDIRFINEVNYFRDKYGAKFIRLERDPELNVYKAALDDLSETELDQVKDWDFKLEAKDNRTPEDLEKFADLIVRRFK